MAFSISCAFKHQFNCNQVVKKIDSCSGFFVLSNFTKSTVFILTVIDDLFFVFDHLNVCEEKRISLNSAFNINLIIKSTKKCKIDFDSKILFKPEFEKIIQLNPSNVYNFQFVSFDTCLTWYCNGLTLYKNFDDTYFELENPTILTHEITSFNDESLLTSVWIQSSTPICNNLSITHHYMTDWEISSDPDFNNIINSSYNDSKNLTSIIFDNLFLNNEYYVRVRYYCFSTNVSNWSSTFRFLNTF